jgi:hypothetical protein
MKGQIKGYILRLMDLLLHFPKTLKKPTNERFEIPKKGFCQVCGRNTNFLDHQKSIRESYTCVFCNSSLRYRHQSEIIINLYSKKSSRSLKDLCLEPDFSELCIYEPGIIGPFRKYLSSLKGYQNSYYWDNVGLGQIHNGVRCENLENLSFSDNIFDLMISSDILEHTRHPELVFKECFRVLKKGGYHIFTVPMRWPIADNSIIRVDTSGQEDIYILPKHYHGNPIDPAGSLVYTDFGLDIVEIQKKIGFQTSIARNYSYNMTIISQKKH